ncbi:hypothetical protein RxyAA322_29710 [Rubrobacter xylanophilus]|uniref:Yip1 domain-containing protein n=1 Tax=Rubrobacter xylanophilus TaxID=49319 RepID=A0A510HQ89_9ACTN|nr:hypothetical protein [Rubrobacter xylanophilus]BBL81117.1 hypothetical protein RxyAA322_29710 [Rubrobacter xylanophilus]
MAKRGYTRDTIRGGASEWDVSRPFLSYLRLLGRLLAHPVAFFEVLPRVSDPRAPALFLAFSGVPAAVLWLLFQGPYPALVALLAPLPLSLVLAAVFHLGTWGGRYGYVVTWRTAAYPLGLFSPLAAVPGVRWVVGVCVVAVLIPVGLAVVRELPARRTLPVGAALAAGLLAAFFAGGG